MRGAHPEREIEAAIERAGVLRAGERVLVACSGGADSVALAAALHASAQRLEIVILLGHVNHAVRASAWQDECVAMNLAAALGVELRARTLAAGSSDEARLRDERYAALGEMARAADCRVIATAHHAADQSESVLLALLRGAGPAGLSGMAGRRPLEEGVELARPLLRVEPEALRAYCHARALPYAVDPSNADLGRRRNAIREALGTLRPLFPGLDRAVARAAEVLAEEEKDSRRAALRRSVRDIDFEHVEAAVRALEDGRSGTFFMKPGIALRIKDGSLQGIIVEE